MVSLGAWLSILLVLFLFTCLKSPRQSMYHNKWEQCIEIIRQAYADVTDAQVTNKMLSVEMDVAHVKTLEAQMTVTRSPKALFFVPANLRSAVTACGIIMFQWVCGFITFMYFSSTPSTSSAFRSYRCWNSRCWVQMDLDHPLDRASCRRLLLWTIWGIPVCLVRGSSTQLRSTRHVDSAADQRWIRPASVYHSGDYDIIRGFLCHWPGMCALASAYRERVLSRCNFFEQYCLALSSRRRQVSKILKKQVSICRPSLCAMSLAYPTRVRLRYHVPPISRGLIKPCATHELVGAVEVGFSWSACSSAEVSVVI
jgi:hypothetical protein